MTIHRLLLIDDSPQLVSPLGTHSGVDITIQNLSTVDYIYIGGEGVSVSDFGYRISPNTAFSIELPGTDALYAVTGGISVQSAILMTNLEAGR